MSREVENGLALTRTEQYQAFRRSRVQSEEPIISLAKTVKDRFAQNSGLHHKIIANPYSSISRTAVIKELGINLSYQEAVRAVVLAEPEAEYDSCFNSLNPPEQKKLKDKQTEDSAIATRNLTSYMLADCSELLGMSDEQIYSRLSGLAFDTDELDVIDKSYSQKQRRGIRLSIVNFIHDMRAMEPYVELFKLSTLETALKIFDVKALSGNFDMEVSPLGIVIKVSEEDYAAIRELDFSKIHDHRGVRWSFKLPDDIRGKIILINKGGEHSGQIYSQEDVEATIKHEKKHIIFDHFFQNEDVHVINNLESVLNNAGDKQNIDNHQAQAELLKRWFLEFARDELISWSGGEDFYYLLPSWLAGRTDMRWYVNHVRKKLDDSNSLNTGEKREIFLNYQTKYQEYLEQLREAHWIAHRLKEKEGPERGEALLQNTTQDEFRSLANYFGVKTDNVSEEMQKDLNRHTGQLSESVDKIIHGGKVEEPQSWEDIVKWKSDFCAVRAYYSIDALPVLLKIVQHAPDSRLIIRSLQTIQYTLEATGGVIPPELGISTTGVRNVVEEMKKKRITEEFEDSRKNGDKIVELTEQLDRINGGGF